VTARPPQQQQQVGMVVIHYSSSMLLGSVLEKQLVDEVIYVQGLSFGSMCDTENV
jgi:hypothetical protein